MKSILFILILFNLILTESLHLNKHEKKENKHHHHHHHKKDDHHRNKNHHQRDHEQNDKFKFTISTTSFSSSTGLVSTSTKSNQDFNQKLNNFNPLVIIIL